MRQDFFNSKSFRWRLFAILLGLISLSAVISGRLFYLQVACHGELSKRCEAQYLRSVPIAASRGNIYDSTGKLLATDLEANSVYLAPADLKTGKEKEELSLKLASILNVSSDEITRNLQKNTYFLWLKRKISDCEAGLIKKLNLKGVGLIKEARRVYLKDFFLANVLGITGLDNQGLSGIEFKYENVLKGGPGRLVAELDSHGYPLFNSDFQFLPPVEGKDIYLTIDEFIQYHAEKILSQTAEKFSASGGCLIAMEPQTGKILAMANYPTFNPNDYQKFSRETRRNRSVNWLYEPGSTFKVISIAAALNEKVVNPKTTFYCAREFTVGGRRIKEAHDALFKTGPKTVAEIMQDSLNIGAAQIGLKLGREKLYQYLKEFGFGEATGVDLPGEERGLLRPYKTWAECDTGIIPFGQGVAVTPLQLLTAVCAVANGGYLVKPHIVESIKSFDGGYLHNFPTVIKKRILSPEVAAELKLMLENVVAQGTGTAAQVAGYRIAGKTGTAQKPAPGGLGYLPGYYVGSFIGFFPLENPKVAILVLIDEPRAGGYYGGVVAAPAFKKLAEEIIPYLRIPPDEEKKVAGNS